MELEEKRHEFFVSLFIDKELINELFVDFYTKAFVIAGVDYEEIIKTAVEKICGDELVNFTMALVQNIDGRGMVKRYRRFPPNEGWTFTNFLYSDEYMKLVS